MVTCKYLVRSVGEHALSRRDEYGRKFKHVSVDRDYVFFRSMLVKDMQCENIYPWCKNLRRAKSEQFLFLVIITTLSHKSSCLTGLVGARRRAPIPKTCIHRIIPIQFIQLALKQVSMCLEAIFSRMPVGRDGYTGPLGRAPASSSPHSQVGTWHTGSCRKA